MDWRTFWARGARRFWIEQRELDAGQFPPANAKLIHRLLNETHNFI